MKKWLMAVQKPVSSPIWRGGEGAGRAQGVPAVLRARWSPDLHPPFGYRRGAKRPRPYLHADHNDEGGGDGDGEGLVVGQLGSIVPGGISEDAVGDEEHEDRGVDALGDADEELPLVEEQVQLSGLVELGVLHAPLLRDVLGTHGSVVIGQGGRAPN